MIKRTMALALALACLLLCGCSETSLSVPPNDSYISGAPRVEFTDDKISAVEIVTTDTKDGSRQYSYQQQGNISYLTETRTESTSQGVLTYEQYWKAVQLVQQKLQEKQLLLQGGQTGIVPEIQSQTLTYVRGNDMTARTIRATTRGASTTAGVFRGYFVYTLGDDDFVGGEQGMIQDNGETPAAFLILNQTYTTFPGSTVYREIVYIFLMK